MHSAIHARAHTFLGLRNDGTRVSPAVPPHIFAVAIESLDARAALQGTSGGLGNAFDQMVLTTARYTADVVVLGASTVTAENYCLNSPDEIVQQARITNGQSPIPRILIVSGQLTVSPDAPIFRSATCPIFLTAPIETGSPHDDRRKAIESAGGTVIELDEVSPEAIVQSAMTLCPGTTRIAVEGGPSIYGSFMAAELIDEVVLTVAPVFVGRGPHIFGDHEAKLASTSKRQRAQSWELVAMERDNSHVFLRYLLKSHR
ncbi:dihydrofolate reductase family protein [Corynebacterium sp. H78]|uniref:dihydrofolate reductase family protein n=1 Tax=Corynebacterium sp. H78 TaxID=3133417 RepID=UPI0030B55F55